MGEELGRTKWKSIRNSKKGTNFWLRSYSIRLKQKLINYLKSLF